MNSSTGITLWSWLGTNKVDLEHRLTAEYVVKIGESWFRVEEQESALFGRNAIGNTDWNNIYGNLYHYNLVPCEPPEQKLPDPVHRFIERYIETGETEGRLVVHKEGTQNLPPKAPPEGWQEKERYISTT